ncbi:antibiotic biosynthesis monooxygenase [Mycolicibacterium komossense]|uniref:Antibiotic biosynthesis monooxygenase n=1 Tax=Mycolicibacterium komossense TaxID=1779 RepID=A0ABT3CKS2_9MYCO|nr:antibiotic biosynthesis monooxygenase [Mycolicibacterium komossense]MCV7230044.1 antibiotic biosynthesis monooxygenase [Mycolicibacterium komossense]
MAVKSPREAAVATAVTIFHPVGEPEAFDVWLNDLIDSAEAADGFSGAARGVHDIARFDWAVAVTFDTEDQVHAWLDSVERAGVMAHGRSRGYWCSTTDIVVVEAQAAPPGIGAFRHSVASGKEADFLTTQVELTAASAGFAGFEGTSLFPPAGGGEWLSLVRFRTQAQLTRWLLSHERAEVLGELRSSLTKEFAPVSSTTPFATTVRTTDTGKTVMTPDWKSAMMVLLVLYPTVMMLSRFFGPVLDGVGAQPWLALWLSQVISVSLMQWWFMPSISRPFRRWLDPIDGADRRISMRGALIILALYAVTLAIFASVKYLQFWDFAR